jgi:hypothetical protein
VDPENTIYEVIETNKVNDLSVSVLSRSITPAPVQTPDVNPVPTPCVIPGEENSCGYVDIVDALLVAQYYPGFSPAGFTIAYADINCYGNVDIVYALLIARYYVKLISEFCWL